jgi:hypothetical protein
MRLLLAVLVTGLHGTVTRGPITPVCMVGKPCSAPAAGVVLIFSRNGRDAARVTTGALGRYSVRLAPGTYGVRTGAPTKIGRGLAPSLVSVPSTASRRVDFRIDTGIR